MSKIMRKIPIILYTLILATLLVLFFTNDFSLVDIHKTTIVMAVGLDVEEDEIVLTAQLAVPQPSENGENTSYTEAVGKGKTVADALNEINTKTGFYPKLLFCELIVLGESCQNDNIFRVLDYFYRSNYSQLTTIVSMCKGSAKELLSMQTPMSNMTALSIKRVLSDELKKSANVSVVNLKMLAQQQYGKSQACYMPYIEFAPQGSTDIGEGGNGSYNDQSGSQGSSGGGSDGGSGGGSQGSSGGETAQEFVCRKTAAFKNGKFAGLLSIEQSFALNLIKNDVNLAIVPTQSNGKDYSVGLKNNKGGVKLKIENEKPVLTFSFKAKAQVQDVNEVADPQKLLEGERVKKEVLKATENSIKKAMGELIDFCIKTDCDVVGARDLLYKNNNKYFDKFNEKLLEQMSVGYEIEVQSTR